MTNHEEPEAEEPNDQDLPNGWTEVLDPNSGQVYYYNTISSETTWTP